MATRHVEADGRRAAARAWIYTGCGGCASRPGTPMKLTVAFAA